MGPVDSDSDEAVLSRVKSVRNSGAVIQAAVCSYLLGDRCQKGLEVLLGGAFGFSGRALLVDGRATSRHVGWLYKEILSSRDGHD